MIVRAPTRVDEQHFWLTGIHWATYVGLRDLLQDQRRVRVNYDRGVLELMTVSAKHEANKSLLGRLFEALTEELKLDIVCLGSLTMSREDLEKGMEPDECYWLDHQADVRGKDELDFEDDPPPDLVIEVEISRSVVDRLAILKGLGVPEVWRFNGDCIRVLILDANGEYVEQERSKAFPFVPLQELVRFAKLRGTLSDTWLAIQFRDWVRDQIAAGWSSATVRP